MRLPRQGTGCKSRTNRSLYAGSASAEGRWCVRTCMRRTEKAQAAGESSMDLTVTTEGMFKPTVAKLVKADGRTTLELMLLSASYDKLYVGACTQAHYYGYGDKSAAICNALLYTAAGMLDSHRRM